MFDEDLSPSTELLNRELPDPRFVDDRYLHWLYRENPYGLAYEGKADEDGVRVAHYALIPQEYRDAHGSVPCVFSLNAVVRSGTQRKGYFTKIGLELYDRASADGRRFAVGVCNAKSIGAVTKYMGWKNAGPLPVRLCPPALGRVRGVEHYAADERFLTGADFDRVSADLDAFAVTGWTNRWTPEHLRWRLARPGASYHVHVSDDLVAVTTRTRRFGVPAVVIMKLLPRHGGGRVLSAQRMVTELCRAHRAPYAVYAGFNAHVTLRGVQPPRRLQPSPLYLILRSLSPDVDQAGLALEIYEFLDQDAY